MTFHLIRADFPASSVILFPPSQQTAAHLTCETLLQQSYELSKMVSFQCEVSRLSSP